MKTFFFANLTAVSEINTDSLSRLYIIRVRPQGQSNPDWTCRSNAMFYSIKLELMIKKRGTTIRSHRQLRISKPDINHMKICQPL